MSDSRTIDPHALDRLREWGGPKLAAQMVRLFLENSGTRMDQIRTGAESGDMPETERGAHSLKSSAANVGAELLRTLSTRMETAALEEEPEVAKRLLPELEAAYSAAMDELAAIEEEMIRAGAVTGDEEVGEGEPIIEEGMPE
jgi:HPt (histidine-containing phosphotransfer) domain-containing protein